MRALVAVFFVLVPAAFARIPATAAADNPFFQEWRTPFGVPPFEMIRSDERRSSRCWRSAVCTGHSRRREGRRSE
jgi:hypothetical protein